ncbi:MAG: DUF3775 domain-containing protein [Pseudomonadota bacterium]
MNESEPATAYELNIDVELVRMIVLKAGAASYEVRDAEDDMPDETMELDTATSINVEDPAHLAEEAQDDATREEASAMIDTLNVDEQAEVVALTWIGRGDYEVEEIATAVRQAKARASGPASVYLFGMEIFPSHLASGLDSYETWQAKQPG